MDQITVSLDGLDHLIGENETTLCGKPVPMHSSRLEGTDPCPVCFPDTVKVQVTVTASDVTKPVVRRRPKKG